MLKYYSCMSGLFATVLSAVIFGFSPYFVYSITACGLSVFTSNLIRFAGASLLLFIYILAKRKGKSILMLVKERKTCLNTFLVGFSSALTAILLTASYNYIPSGLSTVLHFTYPMMVTILYALTKRIKLSLSLVICIVLSFTGVFLVTSDVSGRASVIGIVLALLSAVSFSSHIFMLNSSKIEDYPVDALMFWKCIISAALSLVLCMTNGFGSVSGKLNIASALLFPTVSAIAFTSFTFGTEKIGGPAAGVLSAFEPITAVVVGIALLGEPAQRTAIIGIVLVIVSVIILTWVTEHKSKVSS